MQDPDAKPEAHADLTTVHVRRAHAGDRESLGWLVEHFTPALLLQAGYRLRSENGCYETPEDLVDEVWLIALPRLPQLQARDGRLTPVLVKFLSTTLLNRLRMSVRNRLKEKRREGKAPAPSSASKPPDPLDNLPEETSSLLSRLCRKEIHSSILACLGELSAGDREILVLRGIEQLPNQRVAERLGKTPATVSEHYHRALAHLRTALPRSVFAEL